jgi:hypothetical protein
VIKYLNVWASLIEEVCVAEITLTDLYGQPVAIEKDTILCSLF